MIDTLYQQLDTLVGIGLYQGFITTLLQPHVRQLKQHSALDSLFLSLPHLCLGHHILSRVNLSMHTSLILLGQWCSWKVYYF